MAVTPSPQPFRPTPEQRDSLFDALVDPSLCFSDIAKHFNTSLDALTLFITQPDTMQELSTFESASALRIRLVATNCLSKVIHHLAQHIDEANQEDPPAPLQANTLEALEAKRRRHETNRRACALLFRLANFAPVAFHHRATPRQYTRPQPITDLAPASAKPSSPPILLAPTKPSPHTPATQPTPTLQATLSASLNSPAQTPPPQQIRIQPSKPTQPSNNSRSPTSLLQAAQQTTFAPTSRNAASLLPVPAS